MSGLVEFGCWAVAFFFAWVGLFLLVSGLIGLRVAKQREQAADVATRWIFGSGLMYVAWRFWTL